MPINPQMYQHQIAITARVARALVPLPLRFSRCGLLVSPLAASMVDHLGSKTSLLVHCQEQYPRRHIGKASVVVVLVTLLLLLSSNGQSRPLTYRYKLYSPPASLTNATNSNAPKWPLIIYLHGRGESGIDLDQLDRHGPPFLIKQKQFPTKELWFYLVAPQSPRTMGYWQPEGIDQLRRHLIESYPIDPHKVTITGQSFGGIGTMAVLAKFPEHYKAGLAICGRGLNEWVSVLATKPLWLMHGAKDQVIPAEGSRSMYKMIKEAGGTKVKYDELPDQGHMIHNAVYSRLDVWQWLTQKSY